MRRTGPPPRLIAREKFQQWLESKASTTIVGRRGSPWNCPLARAMRLVERVEVELSELGMVERVAPGPRQPLPYWATRFIRRIDLQSQEHVQAKRALTILAGILN